ncbi:MAG: ABC transporter ATP-binding protein [Gammaproteobacteria bacterium]|nr:ABC transporter ATP-binding protein [Gammaproteobacteria bacterium]MDH3464468.1 ABC transporter ATP-binding protein [Gammaproteobacteria bacterium]
MSSTALQTSGLDKNFGALRIARNINFELQRGARHALIGPNGAGKTTLLNLITGVLRPSAGRIQLLGTDITGMGQSKRTRLGLVRTFQINQLFKGLSVLDNVCLAIAERTGVASSLLVPLGHHHQVIDEAMHLLHMLRLDGDAMQLVNQLPYGRQRLLEIVIALGQNPQVLLLDEPAAGVPSAESQLILEVIDSLSDDIAILIIEHDMEIVFRFAKRITVMMTGAILTEGTPNEIAADDRVRAIYLGDY